MAVEKNVTGTSLLMLLGGCAVFTIFKAFSDPAYHQHRMILEVLSGVVAVVLGMVAIVKLIQGNARAKSGLVVFSCIAMFLFGGVALVWFGSILMTAPAWAIALFFLFSANRSDPPQSR